MMKLDEVCTCNSFFEEALVMVRQNGRIHGWHRVRCALPREWNPMVMNVPDGGFYLLAGSEARE